LLDAFQGERVARRGQQMCQIEKRIGMNKKARMESGHCPMMDTTYPL